MTTWYRSAFEYGNSQRFGVDRITYDTAHQNVKTQEIVVPRVSDVDTDRYWQALDDINSTWGVIKDPITAKEFEIAMANLSAPRDNGLDVELSTFTSSISGNPGNAVEFAENAALNPDRQRLYIASLGNGRSGYWTSEEREYVQAHGRFIDPDGNPLPTIASLKDALEYADLTPTRLSTNSTGGSIATALMAALPEGQVTHAYIKSRPNISDHPSRLLWGAGVLLGDILDERKFKKASKDPWRLTGDMIDEAKGRMPGIYSEEAHNQHKTFRQKAGSSHKLGKMITDLTAASHGGQTHDFPASRDTARAIEQQPEAFLTYHFPSEDRLYASLDDIHQFLLKTHFVGSVAVREAIIAGRVELLHMPGRHRDHTQYPAMRWSMERYAFSKEPAKKKPRPLRGEW